MKIGFAGAAGSGKTTLVNELGKKMENTGIVKEVARDVFETFKEKFGVNSLKEIREDGKLHLRFQKMILDKQIAKEKEMSEKYKTILTDRTVYDIFVYLVLRGDLNQLEAFTKYFNYRMENFKKYDLIFVPGYIEDNVDDGLRSYDLEDRETQELLIISLLNREKWYYVPVMSVNKRINFVKEVIKNELL